MNQTLSNLIPFSFTVTLTTSTFALGVAVEPAQAGTLNPDQIFIFGDSLSDGGNLFNLSQNLIPGGFPPEPFYIDGRFSNGPTWAEYLAEDLGLTPTLFTEINFPGIPAEGLNYAFSGALSDDSNISSLDPNLPGVTQQLDEFTGRLANGQSASPNALYILWIGVNDYIQSALPSPTFPDVTPMPIEVVKNTVTALDRLIDLGARNILVGNMPDLGLIPLAEQDQFMPNNLTALSEEHNMIFAQELETLQESNSGVNLFLLDAYSLFNEFVDNPTSFGLENVTEGCTNGNLFDNPPLPDPFVECNNPDDHLYWDNQHPTREGHRLIANEAKEALNNTDTDSLQVPEPSNIWAFGLLGLGFLGRKLQKSGSSDS